MSGPVLFGERPNTAPSVLSTVAFGAFQRRYLVLTRNFDLHVHNILDYAETRLREDTPCDLDHVAELIAVKVRENLVIVYGPGEER